MQSGQLTRQLKELLASNGLSAFGWFAMFDGPSDLTGKPAILVGNRGRAMLECFSNSRYVDDRCNNPLDRWTKSVIDPVQNKFAATALYPFPDGRNKHWPFQQWAKAATGLKQSPPGLLIDPEYGLWQAFRAVLVFNLDIVLPEVSPPKHPCDSCQDKPCLNTCPVAAISNASFDACACRNHVKSISGTVCQEKGCISRNACPIGKEHAYSDNQQAFHMRAYLGQ